MKDDIHHDVAEWLRFVEMDRSTARHLFTTMQQPVTQYTKRKDAIRAAV
ncbi:MAG: hypothetical protein ACTTJ7_08035 [Treponema sp.]